MLLTLKIESSKEKNMSVTRIASRYAKSLFDVATEKGQVEQVKASVDLLLSATKHEGLAAMLKSPVLSDEKKSAVFKAIFEGKMDAISFTFFDLVLRKNREAFLVDIAKEFVETYRQSNGIVSAKLVTAVAMNQTSIDSLLAELQKSGILGGKVALETSVDESLIGGFVLKLSDKIYDASVLNKLESLKRKFSVTSFTGNN